MYHLTAWPTYKKTVPMFCHKMFRNGFSLVQLGSAEGKQDKRRCRLFTKFLSRHEIWTRFWGGIVTKTSSTLPLEMLSMKYSMVEMLWSDLVTTTTRCFSSSSTANRCQFRQWEDHLVKPASSGSKGTTKFNHVEPFFPTTATSSPESTRIWYTHLQPSKKLMPLFWRLRRQSSKNVDFRNQVVSHLSDARRITWKLPCLEHFCSAQLDHKQSSIENICRVNLSLDLTNLNHPCFDTDIKASLPCQPKPTLEPSNPSGSTLEIGKKGTWPNKKSQHFDRFFFGTKNPRRPELLAPDSTTGLSKSISKTHNKESSCDEARPSLWDVFNPGSEEG